jgi:hypothetical protein
MPMRILFPLISSTVIVMSGPMWIFSPGFLVNTSMAVILREKSNSECLRTFYGMNSQSAPERNVSVAIILRLPLLSRKTRRCCSSIESNGKNRAAKPGAHRKQDNLAENGQASLAVLEHRLFSSLIGPF